MDHFTIYIGDALMELWKYAVIPALATPVLRDKVYLDATVACDSNSYKKIEKKLITSIVMIYDYTQTYATKFDL